jgi:predicted O-linked N-acetylglucosamine transferase (SPINDLY family)
MRGRQSAGMLELIGAADLVAADEDALVANAVRLAEDAPWRAELSARMRDGSKALFDDVEPVAALATALDGH